MNAIYNKLKSNPALSWALYDWANSAFATTVMAGFFPLFFQQYYSAGTQNPTLTSSRLGFANAIASLCVALLAPYLGAIADLRSKRKQFLATFTGFGILGSVLLCLVGSGSWMFAIAAFALGLFGFQGASSFYDSLLNLVAEDEKDLHRTSALGYSLGYLGGGVLFSLNVFMYLKPDFFGFQDSATAIKFSFLSVGIWWAFFSLPLFKFVPEPKVTATLGFKEIIVTSTNQLIHTLKSIIKDRNLTIFMLAYWIYIDAVNTVIKMAVDYGVTIGLTSSSLITALLLVQFIGFPSALLFGWLGNRFRAKNVILFCILIYCGVVLLAIQMTSNKEFYILAACIGFVQGGIQSLSRSTFASQIPPERSGEYFGFFNLVGRFASILGPTLMAFVSFYFSNPRYSIASILFLFVLGGVILTFYRERKTNGKKLV